MIFESPAAFWLLPAVILVLILGFWGWKTKKEIARIWLDEKKIKTSQIKKYILVLVIVLILILAISVPKIPFGVPASAQKEGLIIPMVDVTASMAAQKDLDSSNRLERVKPMLYRMIDEFPKARFYPFHFTSLARSLTPPLAKKDFPYLKGSIERVLDINSVPGAGSSLGTAILQVLDKIPKEEKVKIIVVFSDGEFFQGWGTSTEDPKLDLALRKAAQENVRIITVGIGEKEGSKIPLYDQEGEFTGKFAEYDGRIFVTKLEEEALKLTASRTQGEYFFEDDFKGVIDFLNKNLGDSNAPDQEHFRDISYLLLIPAAVLWIIFAGFYLK